MTFPSEAKMRWRQLFSSLLTAAFFFGPGALAAWACPFCGEANAVDDNRSKAYELSILFMLMMPAVLLGAFGYGFYRLSRRESQNEALLNSAMAEEASGVEAEPALSAKV